MRPRGTTVHLGLGRQGITDLVGVDVVRDKIPDQKRRIGVLHCRRHRLHQAGTVRTDDLRRDAGIADTLRAQGATKLIFDLRGNSGGYLDQAIMVANEFLHKDQLIVYTWKTASTNSYAEYADGTGAAQDMDVVGADRRGQRVVERDPRRGIAG